MNAGFFLAGIIIILEVLRYFRYSKRIITEFNDLKSRVEYLENKIKEK